MDAILRATAREGVLAVGVSDFRSSAFQLNDCLRIYSISASTFAGSSGVCVRHLGHRGPRQFELGRAVDGDRCAHIDVVHPAAISERRAATYELMDHQA